MIAQVFAVKRFKLNFLLNKKYRLILDKGLYDSYSTTKSTVYTKTKVEQLSLFCAAQNNKQ